jgi:hypothetical protein
VLWVVGESTRHIGGKNGLSIVTTLGSFDTDQRSDGIQYGNADATTFFF